MYGVQCCIILCNIKKRLVPLIRSSDRVLNLISKLISQNGEVLCSLYRSTCQPDQSTSSAPPSVDESRNLPGSKLSSAAAINPSSGSTISASWVLAPTTSKAVTAGHDLGAGGTSLQNSDHDDKFDGIIPTSSSEAVTANSSCKDQYGVRVCSGGIDSLHKGGAFTNYKHKLMSSHHHQVRHRLCPAMSMGVESGMTFRIPNSSMSCGNDDPHHLRKPSSEAFISASELLRADQQETTTTAAAAGVVRSAADHERVVVDRMDNVISYKDSVSEASCYNNFGGIKRTFIPAALGLSADRDHHQPHAMATSCDSSSSSDHDDAIVDRLRSYPRGNMPFMIRNSNFFVYIYIEYSTYLFSQ